MFLAFGLAFSIFMFICLVATSAWPLALAYLGIVLWVVISLGFAPRAAVK